MYRDDKGVMRVLLGAPIGFVLRNANTAAKGLGPERFRRRV